MMLAECESASIITSYVGGAVSFISFFFFSFPFLFSCFFFSFSPLPVKFVLQVACCIANRANGKVGLDPTCEDQVRSTTPHVWGRVVYAWMLFASSIVPIQYTARILCFRINPRGMGVTLDGWIVQARANRHLMHATQACKVLPVQMTGYRQLITMPMA
ncbi:hypothetical protein M434DRAFT_209053 [Hypoxylon sp. CO27-5]|nr:hypothetical protein M434DRAFT_209053 [Hypoxylon sp. CO27-5]